MTTIAEKLSALREHYDSSYQLATILGWPVYDVITWLNGQYSPSNGAQDAINRLYDELKEGE